MQVIVMFPYPSGAGLHIGHYYNYAPIDTYCRVQRYLGNEVYQPFGYDAFGLPAEKYAKSVGRDPKDVTKENIEKFRLQIKRMNTLYDEKLITYDPSYIRWTQWLFVKLLEHDLAYKSIGNVNYCPDCQTSLANEQVVDNKCERCNSEIIQKPMEQWYFKITDYKERLINNLDKLDWPKDTILAQKNWLKNQRDWCVSRQRPWGCPIPIKGETDTLDTFVDSSFYWLRYQTTSETELIPIKDWKPVDLYVGGREHACMHLIYARFIHMFLYDIGVVPEEEPFKKILHQGVITNNGTKMSKSKGNSIDPDQFDPDELRLALMFIGPYTEGGPWNENSIVGINRFLNRFRIWLSNTKDGMNTLPIDDLNKEVINRTLKFKFHTVISLYMTFYNKHKNKIPTPSEVSKILELFRCYAPSFKITS